VGGVRHPQHRILLAHPILHISRIRVKGTEKGNIIAQMLDLEFTFSLKRI
jgi:hypothetical protein